MRRGSWGLLASLGLAVLGAGVAGAWARGGADPSWAGTRPQNLSHSPWDLAARPGIAAGPEGRMVVVWSDERTDGERHIYAVGSDDGGRSWSDPTAVSETVASSNLPDVVFVGERAFVAWCETFTETVAADVYEAELSGAGPVRTIPVPGGYAPQWSRPSLAAAAGRLHAVFHAGRGGSYAPDVLYASRLLTESTWLTASLVYTHATLLGSWYPVLAAGPDQGDLQLVWEERHSAVVRSIMLLTGTLRDGGVAWSSPVTLSGGITLSMWPAIAADSRGDLHVVWGEAVGGDQYVRYRHYDAFLASWEAPVRIDPRPVAVNVQNPYNIYASLALWEGDGPIELCVAWHGFRPGGLAEEVLLSCSSGGGGWAPARNVSQSPGDDAFSILPGVTFDALGDVHVVWQEHEGASVITNYEIYHARELGRRVWMPLVLREG